MACDWGDCEDDAAGWRFWPEGSRYGISWLPVCQEHEPAQFALAT